MKDESLPQWVNTASHYLVDYLSLLADIAEAPETSAESPHLSAQSVAFVVAEQARVEAGAPW